MLTINMMGKVNIIYKDINMNGKLSQKLVALICLLVLYRDRDVSKERIVSYLWPDSEADAAKYNLRYNLWMIKKHIPRDKTGEPLIITGKDYCRINKNYPFYCDKILLDEFRPNNAKTVEQLIRLKELFKGDFLEGLYLKNCNEFNELILFERVVCQNKQLEILKELTELYEQGAEYEEALQILNEMVSIEPYNENYALRIIELYRKMGNRTAAIQYYKKLESILRRDLNIAPNQELKVLYRSLTENNGRPVKEFKKSTHGKRKALKIRPKVLKGVDYFFISQIVNDIMEAADKKYMLGLDRKYILDLSYIQNELLLNYGKYISEEQQDIGFVPDVRIVHAFSRFIKHACHLYDVHIIISDINSIDPISLNIINYLEQIKPEHLNIIYEN